MSDFMIKASGLGKKYRVASENTERYLALRDVISHKAGSLAGKKKDRTPAGEFWALKDVNFEIKQGEAVGIIGPNGAGKSTLLKILSRITEPTHGKVEINGRISSLLEVGTGFHPELTGRENIFLNGAILGMSRAEILQKFDEIIDFSGVSKFLDLPVKRYSSGMYVRLAFAIAAHLEPEVLVIDEVLSVGDAEFQKKCLRKMDEVSQQNGRTVLFVSHDLASINHLCATSILLKEGKVIRQGKTKEVIDAYLGIRGSHNGYRATHHEKMNFVEELSLHAADGKESYSFAYDQSIGLRCKLRINEWQENLCLAFAVQNRDNKRVSLDYREIGKQDLAANGELQMQMSIPGNFLLAGHYSLDVSLIRPNMETFDILYSACPFEITGNNGRMMRFSAYDCGDVFMNKGLS